MHVGAVRQRGVGEHRHLSLGVISIAQTYRILDDMEEVGMRGRLTIARESDHVEFRTCRVHLLQFRLQTLRNKLA